MQLKIRARLALAFGATLVLTVVLGLVSLWQTGRMKDSYEFVAGNTLSSVSAASNMSLALEAMRRMELRYTTVSVGGKGKEQQAFNAMRNALQENTELYLQASAGEGSTKAHVDAFNAKLGAYLASHNALIALDIAAGSDMDKQDQLADYLYYGDSQKTNDEARNALKELVAYSYQLADTHRQDAIASYQEAVRSMVLIGVLALAVGVSMWLWITYGLFRQLGCDPETAVEIAEHIAQGDLTTHIDVKPGDQASLLYELKKMRDSISAIVTQVRGATDTIVMGSKGIAQGNMDLSVRTESQAKALQETAFSMEEITGTVKQNAANAQQANQLAHTASEVAVKGGEVVSQVVGTMAEINASSRRIADIISVIDGISFQTNILALNAAVEAARAGEQGRGFAVVAAEVRNLAGRSAAAAKDIKTLIEDSVQKVDVGSKMCDHAGNTMNDVVSSIRRVTDMVNGIYVACDAQTSGIEKVSLAIVDMDHTTQRNAALVEEAASAAASMQDQAGELADAVSVFKLHAGAPPLRLALSAA